jgi:hypothetical protein
LRARHALADRLVLSKVRALFGGRLGLALTGAAPVSREVLEFFDACGVQVLELIRPYRDLRCRDPQHTLRPSVRHGRPTAARGGGGDRRRRRGAGSR